MASNVEKLELQCKACDVYCGVCVVWWVFHAFEDYNATFDCFNQGIELEHSII